MNPLLQFRKCSVVADRGHGHVYGDGGALHAACGKWQVAALAVPLSSLQLSLLPSLLLLLLLLWHCLAIYQRTQTYSLPRPTLVTPLPPHTAPHCHPGPNRWFIALLFRRWCRAFCCSAFLFIASAMWTTNSTDSAALKCVNFIFIFKQLPPGPPSLNFSYSFQWHLNFLFVFPLWFSFNFANSSSPSHACFLCLFGWSMYTLQKFRHLTRVYTRLGACI